jgi:hypothetical protein
VTRIFPVVRRVVAGDSGDPIDGIIIAGNLGEALALAQIDTGPLPAGNLELAGPALGAAGVVLPAGQLDQALALAAAAGGSTQGLGAVDSALVAQLAGAPIEEVGQATHAMTVGATLLANADWTVATVTDVAPEAGAGTMNRQWLTPNNVLSADAAVASFQVATASALATADGSSMISVSGLPAGIVPPAGWTRTKVEIRLNHSWDSDAGTAGSTCRLRVTVHNPAGGNLGTIFERINNQGTSNSASYIDVTALVASVADADLDLLTARLYAVSNIAIGASGTDHEWYPSYIGIRVTYTKASLP